MTEQPPPVQQGWIGNLLNFAKTLSLWNVLTIALLVGIAVPSYGMYRLLNDPVMLGRYLSSYSEETFPDLPCVLRTVSLSGAGDNFAVSTGFAFRGSDRWQVSVVVDRRPTPEELRSYCTALVLIADKMQQQ